MSHIHQAGGIVDNEGQWNPVAWIEYINSAVWPGFLLASNLL